MTLTDMHDKLLKEIRFDDVTEIVTEERTLKYFKSMYAKHVFDAMGNIFKELYDMQYKFVQKLKKQYAEKYA